jgi:hypothetical protein
MICGTVTGLSGARMVGVTVTLTRSVETPSATTATDSKGGYLFSSVPVATYSLRFELPGFRTVVIPNLVNYERIRSVRRSAARRCDHEGGGDVQRGTLSAMARLPRVRILGTPQARFRHIHAARLADEPRRRSRIEAAAFARSQCSSPGRLKTLHMPTYQDRPPFRLTGGDLGSRCSPQLIEIVYSAHGRLARARRDDYLRCRRSVCPRRRPKGDRHHVAVGVCLAAVNGRPLASHSVHLRRPARPLEQTLY